MQKALTLVKTFTASGVFPDKVAAKAEREANNWLTQNADHINVVDIQVCAPGNNSANYTFYLTLLYEKR